MRFPPTRRKPGHVNLPVQSLSSPGCTTGNLSVSGGFNFAVANGTPSYPVQVPAATDPARSPIPRFRRRFLF